MKRLMAAAILAAAGLWQTAAAADLTVSEADHGKTIDMAVGQCLTINLKLQNGTGYDWFMLPNSTELMHLYGRSVTTAGTADHRPVLGGPATDVFSLCAGDAGEGQVLFGYKRPWEKTVLPIRMFELSVRVGK
jgi:predicted secreted protein